MWSWRVIVHVCYHLAKLTKKEKQKHTFNFVSPYGLCYRWMCVRKNNSRSHFLASTRRKNCLIWSVRFSYALGKVRTSLDLQSWATSYTIHHHDVLWWWWWWRKLITRQSHDKLLGRRGIHAARYGANEDCSSKFATTTAVFSTLLTWPNLQPSDRPVLIMPVWNERW